MVGFAFALAHLLIEATLDGEIVYAAGSACGLVVGPAEALVGTNLLDITPPDDRAFLKEVLHRITNRQSTPAVRLTLRGPNGRERSFILGGIRLEGEDILSIGLVIMTRPPTRQPREGVDKLVQTAIERSMQGSEDGNGDDGLMLFVVEEITEMVRKGPIEAVVPILEKLRAYLRAVSVEGDAFKDMGSGKFGLVRAAGVSRDEVQAGIRRILDEFKIFNGIKVYDLSFDLSAERSDLSEEDIARTISYAIRRFSEETTEDYDIKSLRDGANAILQDTAGRLATARQMLRQHNIDIVYQPIVALEDGKAHYLEAMARIAKVESIGAWSRLAEESGLIYDLDLVVADKIGQSLSDYARTGWQPRIAINISVNSLLSSLFLGQFDAVLKPYAAIRRQLMIEVTDLTATSDLPKLANVLAALREKGHLICLDDIGIGAGSFEIVQSLPAEFVKIDGSVLTGLSSGRIHAATMQTIVKMSSNQGRNVIVNNLENQAQIGTIRSMGARFGQGFIFGRPVADVSAASMPEGVLADVQWTSMPAHERANRKPTARAPSTRGGGVPS